MSVDTVELTIWKRFPTVKYFALLNTVETLMKKLSFDVILMQRLFRSL